MEILSDQMWPDEGPNSQGKIITAILRNDLGRAGVLLRIWSPADLADLERAAGLLGIACRQEATRRGRGA